MPWPEEEIDWTLNDPIHESPLFVNSAAFDAEYDDPSLFQEAPTKARRLIQWQGVVYESASGAHLFRVFPPEGSISKAEISDDCIAAVYRELEENLLNREDPSLELALRLPGARCANEDERKKHGFERLLVQLDNETISYPAYTALADFYREFGLFDADVEYGKSDLAPESDLKKNSVEGMPK